MEHQERSKEARRPDATSRGPKPQQGTKGGNSGSRDGRQKQPSAPGQEITTDRNEARRNKYAQDPTYADKARRNARDSYRKDKPLGPSKLANGLLEKGQVRELFAEDMDAPTSVESFTLPEAARALGRAELTLKRWIREGLVPPPLLKDTSRGYSHYTEGELTVLAKELAKHEKDMSNYSLTHAVTQHAIWQSMQAYRSHDI